MTILTEQTEPRQPTARIFSFGGGVQSVAVLVLQAKGLFPLPYDVFVFANVGADSENPATLRYIEDVAKPFMNRHAILFKEVQKAGPTLKELIFSERKSVVIPAYVRDGKVRQLHRNCTDDFKVQEIDRYIATLPGISHCTVGLGISLDEYQRVRDINWHDEFGGRKLGFMKRREYPLIDMRMTRADCKRIIASAGLPEPPKSSCFYCPFRQVNEWIEFKKAEPELFAQAVEIDKQVRGKETSVQGRAYLHRSATPLAAAVGDQESFEDYDTDTCEDGYCGL